MGCGEEWQDPESVGGDELQCGCDLLVAGQAYQGDREVAEGRHELGGFAEVGALVVLGEDDVAYPVR